MQVRRPDQLQSCAASLCSLGRKGAVSAANFFGGLRAWPVGSAARTHASRFWCPSALLSSPIYAFLFNVAMLPANMCARCRM